jgi:hypothetical protein
MSNLFQYQELIFYIFQTNYTYPNLLHHVIGDIYNSSRVATNVHSAIGLAGDVNNCHKQINGY